MVLTFPATAPHSVAYELGRARGYVTGRTVPTERDEEWLGEQPGVSGGGADDFGEDDLVDLELGMLDGAEQAATKRLGLPCPESPSAEMLAAAREVAP